jgi:hypothetical protein
MKESKDLNEIFHPVNKDFEKILPQFLEALNIYVQQEITNIKQEAQGILDVIQASEVD